MQLDACHGFEVLVDSQLLAQDVIGIQSMAAYVDTGRLDQGSSCERFFQTTSNNCKTLVLTLIRSRVFQIWF